MIQSEDKVETIKETTCQLIYSASKQVSLIFKNLSEQTTNILRLIEIRSQDLGEETTINGTLNEDLSVILQKILIQESPCGLINKTRCREVKILQA